MFRQQNRLAVVPRLIIGYPALAGWRSCCLSVASVLWLAGCATFGFQNRVVYQVKIENGDTLASLAQQFDSDWQEIARMNGLTSKNPLRVGQVLRVAAGPGAGNLRVGSRISSSGASAGYPSGGDRNRKDEINEPASGDQPSWREEDLNGPRKTPGADDADEDGTGRGQYRSGGLLSEPAKNFVVRWPTSGGVSSVYGPRWGRFHNGIDIRANKGTPIVAAASGRIIFAGRLNGYGKTVIMDHGQYRSLYGHCGRIVVKRGAWVRAGTHIANVGNTGNSRGAHLHFELRTRRDKPVDPMPFLEAKRLTSRSQKARPKKVKTASTH